jgi:hypothetical protein
MNKLEETIIKDKASLCRLSLSEYLRKSAIETEIKAALKPSEVRVINSLYNIGNNLNQVVKKMHQKGLDQTAEEVEEMILNIKKILE